MASEIRVKLLRLVLDNPEIKRDDIRAHQTFDDEDDRAIANLLYNAKKDEQLVADEGGRYTITAKGRACLKAAGVLAIPQPPSPPPPRSVKGDTPKPARGRMRKVPDKHETSSTWPAARLNAFRANGNKFPSADADGKTNGTASAIAEQLLQDTQAALDRYIASVCDPAVLGGFRAQRDQARALVESFSGTAE